MAVGDKVPVRALLYSADAATAGLELILYDDANAVITVGAADVLFVQAAGISKDAVATADEVLFFSEDGTDPTDVERAISRGAMNGPLLGERFGAVAEGVWLKCTGAGDISAEIRGYVIRG